MNKMLKKLTNLLPDKLYLQMMYYYHFHKFINWEKPSTFNEKLQWLKIYEHKSNYTQLVDKIEVKKYIEKLIGKEYVVPTLGVWEQPEDINFIDLPNKFVLKTNHASSCTGLILCNNKKEFDKKDALQKLSDALKSDSSQYGREWPYKDIHRRILAEPLLEDTYSSQNKVFVGLNDYKVFCFNGEPRFIEVDYDRFVGHKLNVYDLNWNFIDFYMTSPNDIEREIEKPKYLDKMLDLARTLSKEHTFVRVDFYTVDEKIYFSELTFYPGSGFIDFHPKEWDKIAGDMLQLPIK